MTDDANILSLTVGIVASYVEANKVTPTDLPSLIGAVHAALGGTGEAPAEPAIVTKLSALQIRKSITPDMLVSFEDGNGYRMLKRHLAIAGLTPDGYRAKWGLPSDYPMVAASYSAKRSALAKSIGLGQRGRGSKPVSSTRPTGRRTKTAT